MAKFEGVYTTVEIKDEGIIKYISQHFFPDQVFSQADLEDWAKQHDWGNKEKIIESIRRSHYPEDIFPKGELEVWAELNGYIKEKK